MFLGNLGKRKPCSETMSGNEYQSASASRTKRAAGESPHPLPNALTESAANYELPADWKAQLDANSEKFYYWNVRTKETTWIPPVSQGVSRSTATMFPQENQTQQIQRNIHQHQKHPLFQQLDTSVQEARDSSNRVPRLVRPILGTGNTSPLSSPRTTGKKFHSPDQVGIQAGVLPPTTSPVLHGMQKPPGIANPQRQKYSQSQVTGKKGEASHVQSGSAGNFGHSELGALPGMPPIRFCDSPQITSKRLQTNNVCLANEQVSNIKRSHRRTLSSGPPIVSWPESSDGNANAGPNKTRFGDPNTSTDKNTSSFAAGSSSPSVLQRKSPETITSPLSSARKMVGGTSFPGGKGRESPGYGTPMSKSKGSWESSQPPVFRSEQPDNVSPIRKSRGSSKVLENALELRRSFTNRKRRENIVEASMDQSPTQRVKKNYPKAPDVVAMITAVLESHYLFQQTNSEDLRELVDAMKENTYKAGDKVITLGETGDYFYVIGSGEFEVLVPGNNSHRQTQGCFGEFALLYGQPRAATIVAATDASTFALDRNTFRRWRESATTTHLVEAKEALRSVPLLSVLTDAQLDLIKGLVTFCDYKAGTQIIVKGEIGVMFYIIRTGKVHCYDGENISETDNVLELGPNDYFGERALLTDEPRAANVVAATNVSAMVLDRFAFKKILGPLREILDYNIRATVLNQMPLFRILSVMEREKVFKAFGTQQFSAGKSIIRQGDFGAEFFILRNGEAAVLQESQIEGKKHTHQVGVLRTGNHFGEMALLESGSPRGATVVAKTDCECFVLERNKFEDLLGPAKAILSRAANERKLENELKTSKLAGSLSPDTAKSRRVRHNRSSSQEVNLCMMTHYALSDLKTIRTLGTGTFGRVRLVLHEPTGETYALKIQSKMQIVKRKTQANVINEKSILLQLSSPFIIKLFQTFNDQDCLYMLLELVPGGELFSLLQVRGQFLTREHQMFYTACVVSAMESMHERNILYRDLKPENLLIDREGYIKICDFGFAKIVSERTFTLCGTPEYFSPELVLGNGYGKGNDYWTIGILVYEIMNGYTPFGVPEAPQGEICRRIVTEKLRFPRDCDDEAGMELIMQLLKKDYTKRLGCGLEGIAAIRNHPWFEKMNFDWLNDRQYVAPWIPQLRDNLETKFDTYDETFVPETYIDDGSNWDKEF